MTSRLAILFITTLLALSPSATGQIRPPMAVVHGCGTLAANEACADDVSMAGDEPQSGGSFSKVRKIAERVNARLRTEILPGIVQTVSRVWNDVLKPQAHAWQRAVEKRMTTLATG